MENRLSKHCADFIDDTKLEGLVNNTAEDRTNIREVIAKSMEKNLISHLPQGETATIAALHGGHGFQHRLRSVGIMEGKKIRIVARHPLCGPIVVEIEHRQVTIGRGMAQKIQVVRESS